MVVFLRLTENALDSTDPVEDLGAGRLHARLDLPCRVDALGVAETRFCNNRTTSIRPSPSSPGASALTPKPTLERITSVEEREAGQNPARSRHCGHHPMEVRPRA